MDTRYTNILECLNQGCKDFATIKFSRVTCEGLRINVQYKSGVEYRSLIRESLIDQCLEDPHWIQRIIETFKERQDRQEATNERQLLALRSEASRTGFGTADRSSTEF